MLLWTQFVFELFILIIRFDGLNPYHAQPVERMEAEVATIVTLHTVKYHTWLTSRERVTRLESNSG